MNLASKKLVLLISLVLALLFFATGVSAQCTDGDSDGYNASGPGCGPIDCDDADASRIPPSNQMTVTSDTMFCNGTYELFAAVISDMSSDVKLECNNTIIVGNQTAHGVGIFSGVTNISIIGCELRNYSIGIGLSRVNNSNISNNIIRNTTSNAIELEVHAYDNIFSSNTFEDIGGVAIRALRVHSGNQFLSNNFADITQQSIWLYNLTTNNIVANNNITSTSGNLIVILTNNTNISSNTMVGKSIVIADSNYSWVDSNSIDNGAITDNGGCEDSTYVGNSVSGSGGTSIIDINSHRANVSDNFVSNGGAHGIYLNGSSCIVKSNDLMSYIYLFGGLDSNITANNLSMSSGYAIRLKAGSHNNNVSLHNISGTSYIAIESGINNDIENNNFTGSKINLFINPGINRVHNNMFTDKSGINLSSGGSVNITKNNFTLSSVAPTIILDGSSNNRIENNLFYEGRIVLLTKSGQVSENNSLINNTMNTSGPGSVKITIANTKSAVNNISYENNNGRITWGIGINSIKNENSALGLDYNNPIISNNYVEFTPAPANGLMNRTAEITLYNVTTLSTAPVVYRNGVACPTAICLGLTHDGQNNYTFSVTQFSNFTIENSSQLAIWDDNDPEGGSQSLGINTQIGFYANYTNISDSLAINNSIGGDCNISFNVSPFGWFNMTFNSTSKLWEYNRTFSAKGTYTWNVSCAGPSYDWINLTDTVVVANTVPTHNNPILNSTLGTNLTSENLTVYNVSTADPNGDSIKNIFNWFRNDTSLAVLNMPFEADEAANATDYSGNTNHGTNSGATWNATAGMDGRGAYEFNGIDSYVTAGNSSSFNFVNELSVEAWIKLSTKCVQYGRIISKEDYDVGHVDDSFLFALDQPCDDFAFEIYNTTQDNLTVDTTSSLLSTGKWYHVVGTYDINGNISLYLDGVLRDSNNAAGAIQISAVNLTIGSIADGTNNFFNGTIDEVRVYNYSLSQEQIEALYNNRTDLIDSSMTAIGDTWNATITPNDGVNDGLTKWSNPLTIVQCADIDGDGFNGSGSNCGPIDCNDNDANTWPLINQTSGVNAPIISISSNTVLCPGTYQFNLSGSLANIFSFTGNDLEVDCDDATIISNGSGRAINASSNIQNITIKNCNIRNFTNVLYGAGDVLTNDLIIDSCNVTSDNTYFIPDTNGGLGLVVKDSLINASFSNLYAATLNYTNTTFAAYTRISNSNSVIDSCTFLNNTDVFGSSNVTFSNNNISATFSFGMGASGEDITFNNNDIYTSIIFEIAGSANILDNRIYPSSTLFYIQGENKLIQNNTFFAPAIPRANLVQVDGVGFHSLNNSEIKNNIFNSTGVTYTIFSDYGTGVDFNLDNVTIVGNTFISDGGQAIFVSDSRGYLNITGNTFSSGSKYLYLLNYTEPNAHVILENEDLTSLTGSDLIYLNNISNATLTNITLTRSGLYTKESNVTMTDLSFTNSNATIYFQSVTLNETEEFNSSVRLIMENNLTGIEVSSGSAFNTSANITIRNLIFGFMGFPAIYRNNEPCPTTICTPIAYMDVANSMFMFNVTSFSNYSARDNSNLSIYDSNDTLGGGIGVIPGMQVNFTANYTNITHGLPITNLTANCSIVFSQNQTLIPIPMAYNTTLGAWTYNRSFYTVETVYWNVTCNSTIYADQFVADTIPIGQCLDVDGDGFNGSGNVCGPVDCDDNNASIIPLLNGTIGVNNTLNNITSSVLICRDTYNFWLSGTGTAASDPMSYAINIGADDVVLDCNGSTIIGNSSNTGLAARLAHNNITIKNCNISNFTLGIAGVTTFMATDLTIQNNTLTGDNSIAITGSYATNLALIDNDVNGTNDPNVEIGQQNNFNITNNVFRHKVRIHDNEDSIIQSNTFLEDFETDTTVNNLTIISNNISGSTILALGNTTLSDNDIYNTTIVTGGINSIINNTVYPASTGFAFHGDNIQIENNTIYTPSTSRSEIISVRAIGNTYLYNTEIRGNIINSTNTDYAIRLLWPGLTSSSENVTIVDNTIISNDEYAIFAQSTQGYLNITGNNYVGGQGVVYLYNATNTTTNVIIQNENQTSINLTQLYLINNTNVTLTNITLSRHGLYTIRSNLTINNLTFTNTNGTIYIPSTTIIDTEEFNSTRRLFIQNNLIGINTETSQTGFNTSAELTFFDLGYPQTPYLLKDGVRCDNTSACNISYDNANNILYANVSSFSNYSSAASPVSQPNISIIKTDTPDPVLNGALLNYTINITNLGGGNATNVTLIETYSGNTTFNTSSPNPDAGTNNTFSLGNLTTNQTVLVNITVLVNNSVSLGTILTNLVNVTYFNTTNDTQMTFTQENTTIGVTTTALNVTLISPPNANFTNSNDVTFTCNATDSQNATNITLYHNISQSFGANQSLNTSGTNVQAQFNVTNIADGNYTWNCLAYNNQSNTTFAPNNFTFVVDTTDPMVNVGFNDSNIIFNLDIISIDWNVTDKNINTKYMNVTNPDGDLVINVTDDSINVILGPNNLTQEGIYNISIRGTDLAGNLVVAISYFYVNGSLPIVTLINPADNNRTTTNSTFFRCNTSDNTLITRVDLYHNINQPFGFVVGGVIMPQQSYQFVYPQNNMPDGNHTWNCLAYDNESNTNFAPSNFSFIIDTTPPNVSRIFPTSIDQSTRTNMFANVSDNVALDSCNLFVSGNLEGSMTINESTGTANRTLRINTVGTKVVYANCTDLLGFSTFNLTNVTVIETFLPGGDDDDDDDEPGDDDEADNDDDGDNDDDDGRGDNDDDDDDDDWLPEPLTYNMVFTQLVINDLLTSENETSLDPIFIKDNSTVTVELFIENTGTGNLTDITVDIEGLPNEVRLTSISPKYSAELTTDETGYFVAILKTSTLKKPFTMNVNINTAELERSFSQKIFLEKTLDQEPTTTIERVVTQTRSFVVHSYKWLLLLLLLPLLFFIRTTTYGDETAIRNLIESRGIKKYRKIHVPDAVYFKYHEVHNLEPIRLSQSQRNEAKQLTQIYKITYDLAALLVLAQRQLIPRVVTTSYLSPNLKKDFRRIIFVDPKLKRIIRRLHKYVIAEKKKGFSTTAIRDKLLIAGWPKKYINQFIMPGDILEEYIEKEHKDGFTDSQIRSSLVQAGWDKKTVYKVLDPRKELVDYVKKERKKGFDDHTIRLKLLKSGFKKDVVDRLIK